MNSMVASLRDAQLKYNRQQQYLLTRKPVGYFSLKGGHRVRFGDVKRVHFEGNSVEVYIAAKPHEIRQRASGWMRPIYPTYQEWERSHEPR